MMAATTVWLSMALPSRRTPMQASVHSHDVAPLFRLAVRRVRTGDLLRSFVWERITTYSGMKVQDGNWPIKAVQVEILKILKILKI